MEFATFGSSILADVLFSESEEFSEITSSANSGYLMRVQVGFNQLGRRQYARPDDYSLRTSTGTEIGSPEISISSASGAFLGKIRTDVKNSIVKELKFTLDNQGCADFDLVLNALPAFPLLPFSIITINVGNTSFNWYKGILDFPKDKGTKGKGYNFRGFGLRQYLSQLKCDNDYSSGLDIGEIVEDLVKNYVVSDCPINYNASKIDTSTGVVIANDIEFGKYYLDKVFQTLCDIAITEDYKYNFGVDGDGDFYFEKIEKSTYEKTLFVGYSMTSFDVFDNYDNIKNQIIVQRQQGRGAGGAGWELGGIYNDNTSIKKYGEKAETYQVPGFFDDDEIDLIGAAKLEELSEPIQSAKLDGYKITTGTDYLDRGNYRIILPIDEYMETYSEIENLTNWTKSGAGDSVQSLDSDYIITGAYSSKIVYQNALNDIYILTKSFSGFIQNIRFWIRSDKTGAFLTAGCGLTNWNENTVKIDIPLIQTFVAIDWNVEDLDLENIGKFGIRIDENAASQNTIYIDSIEITVKGHKYYKLELTSSVYSFKPENTSVSCEFGSLPLKMENYLSNLLKLSQEMRFTQEIR